MALFACHDDRRLGSFLTPMVLNTITNGIVYKLLAGIDDYLTRATLIIWVLGLIAFC